MCVLPFTAITTFVALATLGKCKHLLSLLGTSASLFTAITTYVALAFYFTGVTTGLPSLSSRGVKPPA